METGVYRHQWSMTTRLIKFVTYTKHNRYVFVNVLSSESEVKESLYVLKIIILVVYVKHFKINIGTQKFVLKSRG